MNSQAVEELRATIYRLHGEGRRPAEIARLAGCALSTVCRALESRSIQDRRRQNGRRPAPPDRPVVAAEEGGRADDRAALDGDPYAGVGVEDYRVVAAADPGSLVPEMTLLRAYIRTTARGVVAATGDERRQAKLMLRTRQLIDVLARVFRASRRGEDRRDAERERAFAEAAEEILTAGERAGKRLHWPG